MLKNLKMMLLLTIGAGDIGLLADKFEKIFNDNEAHYYI